MAVNDRPFEESIMILNTYGINNLSQPNYSEVLERIEKIKEGLDRLERELKEIITYHQINYPYPNRHYPYQPCPTTPYRNIPYPYCPTTICHVYTQGGFTK
jgi:hypothetical protein